MDGAMHLSIFHFVINIKGVYSQTFRHFSASHRPVGTAIMSDFSNAIVCN
jgi:hypothetical protein